MFAGNSYKCGWIEYVEVEYSADAEKNNTYFRVDFSFK